MEDARRRVERAWLEWRVERALRDPGPRQAFLRANGLLGPEDGQFLWNEEARCLEARFPAGSMPPELLGQASGGVVTVRLAELGAVAWHWHEQWCAGLMRSGYARSVNEVAATLILQVRPQIDGYTAVQRAERDRRRTILGRGPARDHPPDIEDLPPCFARVARAHQQKLNPAERWIKHSQRLAFAKFFKGTNHSQLALERFLVQFLGNGGGTPDDVRQKHDLTVAFASKDRYLPAGCDAIIEATRGGSSILGIQCPFAKPGVASPCGECHQAFKEKHPGKSRDRDVLSNPTQHIWWKMRRKRGTPREPVQSSDLKRVKLEEA